MKGSRGGDRRAPDPTGRWFLMSNADSATMKTGPTGLVIPVSGPVEEVILDGGLEQLQDLVEGMIEALPIPDFIDPSGRSGAYCNEEGHLVGLEFNGRATDFMVPGSGIFWGDYIAGPFLLVGFDPRTGEHTSHLPKSVVDRVRLIESEAGVS
jgi:Domain of unknown function (DUF3846)